MYEYAAAQYLGRRRDGPCQGCRSRCAACNACVEYFIEKAELLCLTHGTAFSGLPLMARGLCANEPSVCVCVLVCVVCVNGLLYACVLCVCVCVNGWLCVCV